MNAILRPTMILGLLLLAVSALYLREYNQNMELRSELKSLKALAEQQTQLAQKRGQAAHKRHMSVLTRPRRPPVVEHAVAEQPAREEMPEAKKREMLQFASLMVLRNVESVVALSASQRAALEALLAENPFGSEQGIREILGEEAYAEYREELKERKEKQRVERIEQKTYVLTRALSLDEQQEGSVRQILNEARENFSSPLEQQISTEQKRALYEKDLNETVSDFAVLQANRQAYINDKMRDVLTDEQFNAYLQKQAEEPGLY